MGQHGVHPVERRRAADDRVLHGHVRTQELPHGVDHPLRDRVVPLRNVAHSGRADFVARGAGRGRRGAPLDRAGDAAPDLPARRAGNGAGHLHPRHHRRADARADAGRMDHRQLQLGLVLLHQRADRNRGDVSGDGFSPRSAGHAQETAVDRLGGHFAADDRPRVAPVRARGRAGEGLVQRHVDHQAEHRGGGVAGGNAVVGVVTAEQAPGDRLPRPQESRPRRVDLPLHRARLRTVRRRVPLPAVHAEPAALHADGDRSHAHAGRHRHGRARRSCADERSAAPSRWSTPES